MAAELDCSVEHVRKLIRAHWYVGLRSRPGPYKASAPVYPAAALDLLKGLRGQPHRTPTDPGQDWLSDHLGGTHDQ